MVLKNLMEKNVPSSHKKQNCTNMISYADDGSQTVHLGVWKWNLLTHTQWLRYGFRMANVISCLRRSWIADVTLMSTFKFLLNHFQSCILWSLLTPEPSESEEGKIVKLMHPDCSFLPLQLQLDCWQEMCRRAKKRCTWLMLMLCNL